MHLVIKIACSFGPHTQLHCTGKIFISLHQRWLFFFLLILVQILDFDFDARVDVSISIRVCFNVYIYQYCVTLAKEPNLSKLAGIYIAGTCWRSDKIFVCLHLFQSAMMGESISMKINLVCYTIHACLSRYLYKVNFGYEKQC